MPAYLYARRLLVPSLAAIVTFSSVRWLERKSSVDAALVSAVDRSDLSSVSRALRDGADPNAGQVAPRGFFEFAFHRLPGNAHRTQSPVIVRAAWGNPMIVAELLDAGADANSRDYEGYTALMRAAFVGNISVVRLVSINTNGPIPASKQKSVLLLVRVLKRCGSPESSAPLTLGNVIPVRTLSEARLSKLLKPHR